MTEYTWPEAAKNDKAFGERVIARVNITELETKLESLCKLHNDGIQNWWVKTNIASYSTLYYNITGEHYTYPLQKTHRGSQ